MPFFDHQDVRIYFVDRPGAGDVPLVLLHGLGSSTQDWEFNVDVLGADRRLVIPDLRGFGKSDRPPGPHRPEDYAGDVLALLDDLGIEQFDLLGYSMGGAAAFQLAVDRPRSIRKLILVNTTPSYETNTWRARWEAFMRLTVVRFVGMDRMARIISKRLFPAPEQEELRRITVERYSKNDRASYLAALHGLIGWSVEAEIADIDIPTLVISADQDYTPVATKESYVETMPRARLHVIEDSRHGTPMDQPEEFNRTVLDFLSQG